MFLPLIKEKLLKHADQKQALILQRFFKTGPHEYAEGDKFLGIKVPILRDIAREHQNLSLKETERLLHSTFHEERLLALFILIFHFNKADSRKKEIIYRLYLKSTKYINNWDLVDVTAKYIVGAFLLDKDKGVLDELARSKNMWERRIAILSTFHFIEKNVFGDTLRLAKILLNDKEDLIQKAVGWMLREVGKRSVSAQEVFLKKHYRVMPRTTLRYAIERFPERKRQAYLKGTV